MGRWVQGQRRTAAVAVALASVVALAGCGSDEGDDKATDDAASEATEATAATGEQCAESFNAGARDEFPRLVRLSHADGAPILVGSYTGDEFTAQVYDASLSGDGTEATVGPGACVVTEVGPGGTVLYVFAVGTDGAWHRFLESDPEVPLSADPASRLTNVVEAALQEGQASDVPDVVPTGP